MRRLHLVGIGLGIACLAMATPTDAQEVAKPPVMTHDAAGREQCAMCHSGAMEGIKAMPASHEGWENDVCLMCHAKDSPLQSASPPAVPHDTAGREQCLLCHGGTMEGMKAAPASHKGFDNKACTMCHKPAK
jgi:hypothetical protein